MHEQAVIILSSSTLCLIRMW